MARIEQRTRAAASQREQAEATLRHVPCCARWTASFRECGHEGQLTLRPEDVARSEVFFNSTGCWV
jgi:hypothetical protein